MVAGAAAKAALKRALRARAIPADAEVDVSLKVVGEASDGAGVLITCALGATDTRLLPAFSPPGGKGPCLPGVQHTPPEVLPTEPPPVPTEPPPRTEPPPPEP